jgi:hypothetical protein
VFETIVLAAVDFLGGRSNILREAKEFGLNRCPYLKAGTDDDS